MRKLKTRLAALVAAAALAFGAVAPAAAMTSDELAALLMLLGRGSSGIETGQPPQQFYLRSGRDNWDRNDNRDYPFYLNGGNDRWQGWNHDRRRLLIPAECVFPLRTSDGRRNVVSTRCLSDFGMDRRLPRDCAFEARIRGDRRVVYGARCLEQYGYRFAGYR